MLPGYHVRNLNTAPDAVDDLVLLRDHDITDNGIVNNLRNRYNEDKIYTYIGPVLLSVNPFKDIRDFYTENLMSQYYGKFKFEVAPHVFASAEDAHRKLMATGVNQCVLISGESGAGKTEAAKKVMEYISKVSSDTSEYAAAEDHKQNRYSKLNRTVAEIKDSLLKSNPVLEAFGNAKTIRNDNSSRFGKYMEIQMDYNGTPLGGRITNYLLEKPRVVHQGQGERNFHIFYQLCNGMSPSDRLYSELGLAESGKFNYLCDREATNVRTINDADWFAEMNDAMVKVGIYEEQKRNLFTIVAAVLWLGNMTFQKTKTQRGGQDACVVSSPDALNRAAALLSVSTQDLAEALTTRSRETRIDKVRSPLTKIDDCNKVRDALAKSLYARMFQQLVAFINTTIHTPVSELSLGVLDIYGFEIFEVNSFEQLCINYCNEKLQQYFIQLTLKSEQEEYNQEGIPWRDIKYFNNKIVCDLIESKRPPGIIAFLDEQITLNRDDDLSFLNKMNKQLNHPHYVIPPSNKSTPTEFVVRHYAGDVKYSAEGMIDKNKDTLFRDLLVLCGQKSQSGFIANLFPEGKQQRNMKRPVTAGTQFVADMNNLISELEKCEPHYIRCIKPNDKKRSNHYDDELVLHQVKYLGLLQNVKVRRAGYAYRRKYDLFVRRYKMLSQETWPVPRNRDDRANTQTILNSAGINQEEVAYGKTKIFIEKPGSLFELEKAREKAMHWVVGLIQGCFRRWQQRLYFQKMRKLSVELLHGKKRRTYSWVLYFLGDYIRANDDPAIMNVINEHGDGRAVFADTVKTYALGKKRSTTEQTLIITNRSFIYFKSKPGTTKKDVYDRVTFDQIESLSFSTFADNFILLKPKATQDPKSGKIKPVPSLLFESVRKSEIATSFNEAYRAAYQMDAPLVFQDTMTLHVMEKKMFGKPKAVEHTLEFFEDQSIMRREAVLVNQPGKKEPGYNPTLDRVGVSSHLASQAQLQLNTPLPARVLEHTAVGRQGKKRRNRGRRRQY